MIPGKEIIIRDNKTYYWCLHHTSVEYGYANGLYVSSHKPEEHEEWSKNKNMFYHRKSKDSIPKEEKNELGKKDDKKGLVMIDRVKQILTTSQPHLTPDQVKAFIKAASKE